MTYTAHVNNETGEKQSVKTHLLETAELSSAFGAKLGLQETCYLAGLLHDLGKFSDKFQTYLADAVAGKPTKRGSVDHSTAGGRLLYEKYHQANNTPHEKILAELVGNAVISHHASGGLRDAYNPLEPGSDYLERVLDNKKLVEYQQSKERFFTEVISEPDFHQKVVAATHEIHELCTLTRKGKKLVFNDLYFILKFIYSCLIDADRTNTVQFENQETPAQTQASAESPAILTANSQLFETYQEHLEAKIATFHQDTLINRLRNQMSQQCLEFAEKPTDIYTLSIPTGGGKTLASLRFALAHARKHQKQRIIYVVPFTTIIEQNAAEVKDILQDQTNILEHHSNVISQVDQRKPSASKSTKSNLAVEKAFEKELEEERQQAFMRDNWDAPIIFTTMVQFLETVYSRGTRKPRRFHNLMNAVIIFDEAQGVPIHCTHLFNEALNFLKNYGDTTSVLCTATQPALEDTGRKLQKNANGEMIQQLDQVEQAFKRVEIVNCIDYVQDWDVPRIASLVDEILTEKENVLVIMNTKKAVRALYDYLAEQLPEVEIYHLSTAMCAAHRKEMLAEIKERLQAVHPEKKLVCVTTQLIEAGVDISFQAVVRSLAGLDSIAQAVGRCNRNGEVAEQKAYLINVSHTVENTSRLQEIETGKKKMEELLTELKKGDLPSNNLLSYKNQANYFRRYYQALQTELSYPVKKTNLTLFSLLGEDKNGWNLFIKNYPDQKPMVYRGSPKTIGKYFQVIDQNTRSVLVPYGEGKELIAELNGTIDLKELGQILRRAQQYSVNVFEQDFQQLAQNDSLVYLADGKILVAKDNAYSERFGLDAAAEAELTTLTFG